DSIPKMYDKIRYAYNKASEFGRWLRDSLENNDFKRVQNSLLTFPKIITKVNEDLNIEKTTFEPKVVRDQNEKLEYSLSALSGNVCSLRMISRPKKIII